MALKKSQLYSSLWQSCDELRGGMDASQYKDYVLTLLFMKYVSDKHAGDPDALIEVPAGGGFADMARLKGDKEIGDKINKIIGRFAEANDLKGVVDQADFNDESKLGAGKEMQDRLSKLVAIFEGLDFRSNRAGGDDLLGDAYEYLMRHFDADQHAIAKHRIAHDSLARALEEIVEELGGQGGLLKYGLNDIGKPTKAIVQSRLKAIRQTGGAEDKGERYADPLPKLDSRVAQYSATAEEHLRRVGLPA